MSTRSRIVGFGSAGLLVVLGIGCAVVFGGALGQNLAFALVALGLVEGTALVFYEVGLTEDRARARERAHARAKSQSPGLSGGSSAGADRGIVASEDPAESSKPRQPRAPGHGDGEVRPDGPRVSAGRRLDRMRGRPRRLR